MNVDNGSTSAQQFKDNCKQEHCFKRASHHSSSFTHCSGIGPRTFGNKIISQRKTKLLEINILVVNSFTLFRAFISNFSSFHVITTKQTYNPFCTSPIIRKLIFYTPLPTITCSYSHFEFLYILTSSN